MVLALVDMAILLPGMRVLLFRFGYNCGFDSLSSPSSVLMMMFVIAKVKYTQNILGK